MLSNSRHTVVAYVALEPTITTFLMDLSLMGLLPADSVIG
jgi:hypothetical protein